MATDLTTAAAANAIHLSAAANARVSADASGELGTFRTHGATAVMTSNVDFAKVLAFDNTGMLLHSRALHVHWASGDVAKGEAAFAQRSFSKRREAFEDLWLDGRTALYGALNTGGIGTVQYGSVCVVIAAATSGASGLGIFPSDSAQTYTDLAANVDSAAALSDVCGWTERSDIVVLERGSNALAAPQSDWPWLICHLDHYLEVVRTGAAPLGLVAEVRFERDEYRRLRSLRARRARGVTLPPEEQAAADAFNTIQGWRSTLGVTIDQV